MKIIDIRVERAIVEFISKILNIKIEDETFIAVELHHFIKRVKNNIRKEKFTKNIGDKNV
jgi:hypothetical protein